MMVIEFKQTTLYSMVIICVCSNLFAACLVLSNVNDHSKTILNIQKILNFLNLSDHTQHFKNVTKKFLKKIKKSKFPKFKFQKKKNCTYLRNSQRYKQTQIWDHTKKIKNKLKSLKIKKNQQIFKKVEIFEIEI